jgi:hypothetical protein
MVNRGLIRVSLLYWVPVALFIWATSFLGDCFEADDVCATGRREGIAKLALWFGGLFIVLVVLRLRFGRRR